MLQACPGGWMGPHLGMCYKLSDTKLNWNDANTAGCGNLTSGGHLASVTYANKAFLSKQSNIFDSAYYWVGLRSGDTEWNKGTPAAEPVDFTNWEEIQLSEPNGTWGRALRLGWGRQFTYVYEFKCSSW